MRVITVAGQPSCGKTSVILKVIALLNNRGIKAGVVKFDCLKTFDGDVYASKEILAKVEIAGSVCPDHYFMMKICEDFNWGMHNDLDVLIVESAGLCNRCSPHIREIPAICVIDHLSGIRTPDKIGPMMKYADFVIATKGDIVSQAEREVFLHNIKRINPKAKLVSINGITGQGAFRFADFIERQADILKLDGKYLRFPMPSALCSYCVGQTKIKSGNQNGSRMKNVV